MVQLQTYDLLNWDESESSARSTLDQSTACPLCIWASRHYLIWAPALTGKKGRLSQHCFHVTFQIPTHIVDQNHTVFKVLVHPKIAILLFTHPHVVPNP